MNTKEAVAQRIVQLCSEKGIAVNALGNMAGISPSTIYSMLNSKSKNPGIVTIKKLCDGLDISLAGFFNTDVFRTLEQEINKYHIAWQVTGYTFFGGMIAFKRDYIRGMHTIWVHAPFCWRNGARKAKPGSQ